MACSASSYGVIFPPTGEFTRSAWGFPWRWRLATNPTQTQLPKAVQPPRTNLLFEKYPMCLFHLLVLFVVGAYVYFAAKTLRNAIRKTKADPRLHAKCFHNLPRTWTTGGKKKPWKADEHESSKTLTMRGITSGWDLECCILYERNLCWFFFLMAENPEMQKNKKCISLLFSTASLVCCNP